MKTFKVLFGVLIFTFLFTACQKEYVTDDIQEPSNESPIASSTELQPYLQAFIAAGNDRGLNIPADLDGITYVIEPINNGNVAGYCYWNSATPNHIAIDSDFWSWADNDLKEQVVFHELGHCYLNRDHDDGVLNNGWCRSIMHSGTTQNCNHAYSTSNKAYYQDELFGSVLAGN